MDLCDPISLLPAGSPDDTGRVAQAGRGIALGRQNLSLDVDELAQARLLGGFGIVAARRADEEHVLDARHLRRGCKLHCNVELVMVRRRHEADGVAADLLQRRDHAADAARLVSHYVGAQRPQLLCLRRGRIHRQPRQAVDLLGEPVLLEEQLGNEEARLAVNGRDTDAARHLVRCRVIPGLYRCRCEIEELNVKESCMSLRKSGDVVYVNS